MRFFTPILLFIFILSANLAFGQSLNTEFGKNRVQFHQDFDEWMLYESRNFITYWYGEGRNIGQAVVQMAETDFEYIQNLLEHRINDKIEILVYTDITDVKQSNIGNEDTFTNTGGLTKIVGNKVFVYFDGNHLNLRKQVREGIASIYLNSMLFGSNLQEIVQNAVMMNLPEWFKQGLIGYVGEEWNAELDDELRDIFLRDDQLNFEKLSEKHPKLIGHSLWYYISQNYGKSTVSNLLYLTRINRSIESGFLYVLGSPYYVMVANWRNYFEQRYKSEVDLLKKPDGQLLEVKNKRNLPLTQLKISPNGKKIAYVENELGKYKVFVQDIATGDRQLVLKGGFCNAFQATDYKYPLVAWNPSGFEMSIIYEKRDVIKLMKYDLNTKDKIVEEMPGQYHRIHSMDYINNIDMLLSATVSGFSDLFIFKTNTRQTDRITQDFYDDLDAVVIDINNQKGVLFASNRTDNVLKPEKMDSILPVHTFDIFYYDLTNKNPELVQVTNTPMINEKQPTGVDSTYFAYLSDENGIYNRKMAYLEDVFAYNEQIITLKDGTEIVLHQDSSLTKLDSNMIDSIIIVPVFKPQAFAHNHSNYNRNIKAMHHAKKSTKAAEIITQNGKDFFYIYDINPGIKVGSSNTKYKDQLIKSLEPEEEEDDSESLNILETVDNEIIDVSEISEEKKDSGAVDIDNYMFQSEFDDEEVPAAVIVEEDDGNITLQRPSDMVVIPSTEKLKSKIPKFRPARIIPYRIKFKTDFVTTQLDNSQLFGGLDSYAGEKQEYSYPAPGILLKANFKDLFEDYEVEGGIRIPTTFNGAEYFIVFDDKKKRIDKRYAVYRRALKETEDNNNIAVAPEKTRDIVLLGMYQLKYPFDIFRSLRATAILRSDKRVYLATDVAPLVQPSDSNQRFGLKLEYIFDNTLDVALNIKNGTRYKVFAEVMKRFQVEVYEDFNFDFGRGYLGVLGIDARHYQRLDKHSIFAARIAANTTFGAEKIVYFLGGVDNWLFPQYNNEIPFPQGDFAYQTMAANMRGFQMNIRNGNSFALLNTELRIPIFKYVSKNLRSSFLRNFQVVPFFDLGTAWQGTSPFNDENPLNTSYFQAGVPTSPSVLVKVNYFRDPVVMGYGVGARSTIFGYFVKVDYAWGIETRETQSPIWYISIGTDF